jgi:hypothetical protein
MRARHRAALDGRLPWMTGPSVRRRSAADRLQRIHHDRMRGRRLSGAGLTECYPTVNGTMIAMAAA